jgi:hypothetical protein
MELFRSWSNEERVYAYLGESRIPGRRFSATQGTFKLPQLTNATRVSMKYSTRKSLDTGAQRKGERESCTVHRMKSRLHRMEYGINGQACLSRQSSLGEGTCSPQAASIFGNFFQLRTTVPRRDGGLGPVNKSCSRIWGRGKPANFHCYSLRWRHFMVSCEEGEAGVLCTQAVNMSMHGCCLGDCCTKAKQMAATTFAVKRSLLGPLV